MKLFYPLLLLIFASTIQARKKAEPIELFYKAPSLYGLLRQSIAFIVDGSAEIGVLINGDTGQAFTVHTDSVEKCKRPLWNKSHEPFNLFFGNLPPVAHVLRSCGRPPTSNGGNDADFIKMGERLNDLLQILKNIIFVQKHRMNELLSPQLDLQVKGSSAVGVSWKLRGVADLTMGDSAIISGHPKVVKLPEILNSQNGIEALLSILKQIDIRENVPGAIASILNNPDRLLDVLVELGGDGTNSIDRLIHLIQTIRNVGSGRASPETLIRELLKLRQDELVIDGKQIETLINQTLKLVEHDAPQLRPFTNFLRQVASGNVMFDGHYNISEILKALQNRNPIQLFMSLQNILLRLGIGLNPMLLLTKIITTFANVFPAEAVNAIEQFFQGTNLDQLQSGNFNVSAILPHIPFVSGNPLGIISNIFNGIEHNVSNLG